MRPYDLAFLILGGSQGLRERSLTSVPEEVVVPHTDLPSLINASDLGEKKQDVLQMAVASATRAEKNGLGARWSLTFIPCPIARRQPTIKQLPIGETS